MDIYGKSMDHLDTPDIFGEFHFVISEAAAMEGSCSTAGCSDPHTMSKAQEAQLDRQKVAPPPAPPALPEEARKMLGMAG